MENIRYNIIGEKKEELLHPTAWYIKQAFGDDVKEIRHRIGNDEEHIYHFGKKLGNTTTIIMKNEISSSIFVDITGERDGCRTTKSELEKKFNIKLIEL